MSAWDCPACGSHNSAISVACVMCGGPESGGSPVPQQRSGTAATVSLEKVVAPAEPAPVSWADPVSAAWPVPVPRAEPVPLPYASPARPGRSAVRLWLPVLGTVALLAAAAAGYAVLRGADRTGPGAAGTAPAAPTTFAPLPAEPAAPPPAPSPTTPSAVGVVVIAPEVTDPRAAGVAALLDTYFSGINAKDYPRALSAYDPAGVIDPGDPRDVAHFRQGVSTTTDSDIVLRAIGPDTSLRGALTARVTFQSSQQPGYGPRERASETCTRWDVTYTLSEPAPDQYRILASQAGHAPC